MRLRIIHPEQVSHASLEGGGRNIVMRRGNTEVYHEEDDLIAESPAGEADPFEMQRGVDNWAPESGVVTCVRHRVDHKLQRRNSMSRRRRRDYARKVVKRDAEGLQRIWCRQAKAFPGLCMPPLRGGADGPRNGESCRRLFADRGNFKRRGRPTLNTERSGRVSTRRL